MQFLPLKHNTQIREKKARWSAQGANESYKEKIRPGCVMKFWLHDIMSAYWINQEFCQKAQLLFSLLSHGYPEFFQNFQNFFDHVKNLALCSSRALNQSQVKDRPSQIGEVLIQGSKFIQVYGSWTTLEVQRHTPLASLQPFPKMYPSKLFLLTVKIFKIGNWFQGFMYIWDLNLQICKRHLSICIKSLFLQTNCI